MSALIFCAHIAGFMTKRLESKYKVCRRLGVNLWGRAKSPTNKREYGPGQHGQRRRKPSDFGNQLQAKQKLRCYYGNITEKQFQRYYEQAVNLKGDTGENLVGILDINWEVSAHIDSSRWGDSNWKVVVALVFFASLLTLDSSAHLDLLCVLRISSIVSTHAWSFAWHNSGWKIPLAAILLASLGILNASAERNLVGVLNINWEMSAHVYSSRWSDSNWEIPDATVRLASLCRYQSLALLNNGFIFVGIFFVGTDVVLG